MSYLIIADWDANFCPNRTNVKENEADAIALVAKLINDMPEGEEAPNAFYVENPGVNVNYITVDPVAKTITIDTVSRDAEIIAKALNKRLGDVSTLFEQKIGVGFAFNDPGGNPQVFESTDSGLRWLDRSALRARKSKDDTEGKTFKARCAGRVKVVLTDDELIIMASDFFDWGTTLDDTGQDHKDALYDIAEGAGTTAEILAALADYNITTGW